MSGLTTVKAFGADYEAAQAACSAAEREASVRQDLDVVLLSADSLETIEQPPLATYM